MSLILSARYVHAPRRAWRCDGCGKYLGPHVYLYGRAHETERPGPMRLCIACLGNDPDPKVAAARAAAATHAPDAAAEARRLDEWNRAEPIRDGGAP